MTLQLDVDRSQPALNRLPRVLLVEDDAAIRQFVALAVEDLPIQLVTVPTLQAARQAIRLAGNEFALILLDMMLPDGTGLDLLRDPLRMRPDLLARWVVFSAGIPAATRVQLSGLGVAEVLDKPVPLDRLLQCVNLSCAAWRAELSESVSTDLAEGSSAKPHALASQTEPEGVAAGGAFLSGEAAAIQTYFFGQTALFLAMKAQTLQRLPEDIRAVEQTLQDNNAAHLQRAAHNLKSVTRMMGRPLAADLARALENAAAQADVKLWPGLWARLRSELERWQKDA